MVVLHCDSPAQVRSTSNPVLPLSDLLGRPARVIQEPTHRMGQRYHLVEFQPWEGGPDTVVTLRAKAKLLKPAPLDSVSA
ncbi:unnamed protein product, partial [Ectocarpus sp. 12 AP-2014]